MSDSIFSDSFSDPEQIADLKAVRAAYMDRNQRSTMSRKHIANTHLYAALGHMQGAHLELSAGLNMVAEGTPAHREMKCLVEMMASMTLLTGHVVVEDDDKG
jgi:hypothetical protein